MTTRLSVLMFLQFFIFGAWYVTVGNFMAEAGMGDLIYWAYTVGPIDQILEVGPGTLGSAGKIGGGEDRRQVEGDPGAADHGPGCAEKGSTGLLFLGHATSSQVVGRQGSIDAL